MSEFEKGFDLASTVRFPIVKQDLVPEVVDDPIGMATAVSEIPYVEESVAGVPSALIIDMHPVIPGMEMIVDSQETTQHPTRQYRRELSQKLKDELALVMAAKVNPQLFGEIYASY